MSKKLAEIKERLEGDTICSFADLRWAVDKIEQLQAQIKRLSFSTKDYDANLQAAVFKEAVKHFETDAGLRPWMRARVIAWLEARAKEVGGAADALRTNSLVKAIESRDAEIEQLQAEIDSRWTPPKDIAVAYKDAATMELPPSQLNRSVDWYQGYAAAESDFRIVLEARAVEVQG